MEGWMRDGRRSAALTSRGDIHGARSGMLQTGPVLRGPARSNKTEAFDCPFSVEPPVVTWESVRFVFLRILRHDMRRGSLERRISGGCWQM